MRKELPLNFKGSVVVNYEMEIDVGDAERELNQTLTEQDNKSTFVRLIEDPGVFVFRDQQFFEKISY